MIYYATFFILVSIFLGLGSGLRSRDLSAVAAGFAIVFCGLRYETGYDYDAYRSFFEQLWMYEGLVEPGFYYFVQFANTIGISTFAMFFLFAVVTHGIAYIVLTRASVNPNLAFLIYLLIPGLYLNSFSILRQALAVSLFGYAAFRLVTKGSGLKYLLVGLVAISFHFTAVIPFTVAYILFRFSSRVPTRLICIVLLMASLIMGQFPIAQTILGMFAGTKFESYVDWMDQQSPVKVFASNLLAVFIICHLNSFEKDKTLTYFFKIWLVGAILYNVFIQFTPLTRISYYFSFLSIPLLVYATYLYAGYRRVFMRSALVLFFVLGFSMSIYTDMQQTDGLNMSNYKTILEAP